MESDPLIYDILVDPETGDVIVGGSFRGIGVGSAHVDSANIARWDGSRWHAYGDGLGDINGPVHALAWYGGDLVASGSFDTTGTTSIDHVVRWDGSAWVALGDNAPDGFSISALESVGTALFAGGVFAIDGEDAHVAVFDGTTWSGLGAGASDVVEALVAMDEGVYFGGGFDRVGTSPSVGLALWQYAE